VTKDSQTLRSGLGGLSQACHPGPTAVVTLVISTMALAAGRDLRGVMLMGAAAFTGQLSVGWSNDAHDAARDQQAARTNKPTVRGLITASQLWMFAIAAVIMCVPLSFAAGGPLGGGAHVIAVASAWTYNLYFKTTRLSWLPYAVSFGLIPAFVTYGLTPPHAPAVWLTAAAALMGVGAHLANALPDLESDDAIGVGGVASSLGRHNTAVVAVSLLFMAIALLIANVHVGIALSSAAIVLALVAIAAALRSSSDALLFRVIMGLALVAVALLLVSSTSLSS